MRILKSIKNIKANKFSHKDIDCKRCKPRIVGRPRYAKGGIIDGPPTSLRKCSECGEHDNFFIYRNALINQITGQVEHVCNLENNEEEATISFTQAPSQAEILEYNISNPILIIAAA